MKKITVLAVFFITAIILTGCGNKQAVINNTNNREFRRPDFGQPDRQADISGIVTAITGNEVTVLKIDRSQRSMEKDGETGEPGGEEGGEDTNNFRMNLNGATGGSGGAMRFSGGPPGEGQPGEMDEDSRAAMLERMKAMSSGEEKITIPVGIRMLKPDTASEDRQPEMIEATLSDIAADKTIQVWLNESVTDRQIAEFVMVMR